MNRILLVLCGLMLIFSSCQKENSFEIPTPAVGSLKNTLGECLPSRVSGTYATGKALNDTNYIEVTVDVITPGSYTITTDTINGYSFKGTGSFSSVGASTVRLKGSGTPLADGIDNFGVTFDSTFCTISVTVTTGGSTAPGVYFPLTANSYWTYDDEAAGDTLKTVNSSTVTVAGQTYNRFVTTYEVGGSAASDYRKDASASYYQRFDTAGIGAALDLTLNTASFEVLFLKDVLAKNEQWTKDINGTFTGAGTPLPAILRFTFKCTENNATVTANGKTFTNVYSVQTDLSMVVNTIPALLASYTQHYAKGIGYIKYEDGTDTEAIRFWKVN